MLAKRRVVSSRATRTPAAAALIAGVLAVGPAFSPAATAQQAAEVDPAAARLWNDFSHYVSVARPALAVEAGEALAALDDAAVLAAVEADDRPLRRVFDRAEGMDEVADVAARLDGKLAVAARAQALDPERIAADVARLGTSQRSFGLAVDRLAAAGPYAAPELLARLQDPADADLHPFILEALEAIGQPMVAPLSTALPNLPPVAQGQVARVLASIGYPAALPALQEVAESPEADAEARNRANRALAAIAASASVDPSTPASRLYAGLGNAAYELGSRGEQPPGYQLSSDEGPVWVWSDEVGLVAVEVPGPLYADALARQAAEKALALDSGSAEALTLFLAADLRSGITSERALSGAADPSRSESLQPPSYYLSLAGPDRSREVLDLALANGDAGLALAAVRGASATGSSENLAPLARGLSSPDRRVRFAAASALADARPRSGFSGDAAVLPTLASVIRRDGQRYAVVLAANETFRNALSDASSSAGFEPLLGDGLDGVRPQVEAVPGVDLLIARGTADQVSGLLNATNGVASLAAAPIVAFVSASDQVALQGRFGPGSRLSTVVGSPDASTLEASAREALARAGGDPIEGAEAEANALEALRLLRELALDSGSVLQPSVALNAVVSALDDDRPAVAEAAGDTAAALDERDAQEGLARVALDGTGETQIAHLRDLAESATRHGNLIAASRGDQLLELVRSSEGELALAAANAHGALALPTENAVTEILSATR